MKFNTRLKIALALLFGRFSGWEVCANRFEATAVSPSNHEIRVIFRRLWEPDGYAREELVKMLCLVREHQTKQGWTKDHIADVDAYAWEKSEKVKP